MIKSRLSRYLELLFAVAILAALEQRVSAQGVTEVRFNNPHERIVTRYAGGTVTYEESRTVVGTGRVPDPIYEVTVRANVSELDLENARVEETQVGVDFTQAFVLSFHCRSGNRCMPWTSTYRGASDESGVGDRLNVYCETRSECENFLAVLKGPQRSITSDRGGPPQQSRQVQQQPPQPRATPTPAPPVQPRRSSDAGFGDILGGIAWRNGGSGKSALDSLVTQTEPIPNKSQRPPAGRPTFAAFAQSGGFDANDGWSVATGTDLNGTIGRANSECVNRAGTTCDDQGYCMLRPGMWGAWASDLKYLGNKAFACNFKTEEEARNQALAWCGNGCKVLWIGVGK